jgi:lipopolysaccharide export system permease protein
MSAMCVMALTLKHGEINPLLAAGVPLYRVAMPLVIGVVAINALLSINEELILPRIAMHLQGKHGDSGDDAQQCETTYDETSMISIGGEALIPDEQTIRKALFMVPENILASKTFVFAETAVYQRDRKGRRAGWLLSNTNVQFDQLRVRPEGKEIVQAGPSPNQIFIRSALTFDQLYNRSTGFRYLSTLDLVWRIRNPSAGDANRRAQVLHFHERLTRPLLTVVGVFLVIPLVARRDKLSLVSNVAMCMATVGTVYACSQALLLIGQTGWISPAACAWFPLIGGGTLGAWLSPVART